MRIIIDCEYGTNGLPEAYHIFDTSLDETGGIHHPTDDSLPISALELLKYMHAHKDMMSYAGWLALSKLPGLPRGTTRWSALVNQANSDTADADVKALSLT
jgi:hypothetical protein